MLGLGTVRRIAGEVRRDVRAAYERDPAATNVSATEILASWPGVHALLSHRVAHALDAGGVPVAPRLLSYFARSLTGIEIHPAADIGEGLFIDHGMGVVIGETAEVGDDCTIYQGVTLGGTSLARKKRHPTLGNRVVVGAGAKILGPIVVGDGAKIGSNAVVVKEVPEGATAIGIPARIIEAQDPDQAGRFAAYAVVRDLNDPLGKAIHELMDHGADNDRRIEHILVELRRLAGEVERLRSTERAEEN